MTLNPFKIIKSILRGIFSHSHKGIMRFSGGMIVVAIFFCAIFALQGSWFNMSLWIVNLAIYGRLFKVTRRRHKVALENYYAMEDMIWEIIEKK